MRTFLFVTVAAICSACGASGFKGTYSGEVSRTSPNSTQVVVVNETWIVDDTDPANIQVTKQRAQELCTLSGKHGSDTAGGYGMTITGGTCRLDGIAATVTGGELNEIVGADHFEAFVKWSLPGGGTVEDRGQLRKK